VGQAKETEKYSIFSKKQEFSTKNAARKRFLNKKSIFLEFTSHLKPLIKAVFAIDNLV
jgi:hypothetical protein